MRVVELTNALGIKNRTSVEIKHGECGHHLRPGQRGGYEDANALAVVDQRLPDPICEAPGVLRSEGAAQPDLHGASG